MLECDYLVIGTGASGMAFVDAIVRHGGPNRTVIMVDKLPEPGGHWNHAYDFVKLHQPACFYGVASEKLEKKTGATGLIRYEDLSSKREILEYYRYVMDKFLKTGRVVHYGECTYQHDDWDETTNSNSNSNSVDGDDDDEIPIRTFVDKEGISHAVKVKRRVVDATYLDIRVPSQHPPRYEVDPSVECVPVNGIHEINTQNRKFVVVGGGKTGIDAVLHLLHSGVDPSNISWVISRDAWLMNRAFFDPPTYILRTGVEMTEKETHRETLLYREREGMLLRLDETVWPEKSKCATVTREELEDLRSIRNVIRKGRVSAVTPTHLVMTGTGGTKTPGEAVPYETGALIVDCSSNGLPPRPEVPIFSKGKIVIQSVMTCLTCTGADLIGYVECLDDTTDDDRNRILVPVPFPDTTVSHLRTDLLTYHNYFEGFPSDPRVEKYFNGCRLNISAHNNTISLVKAFAGSLYRVFSTCPAAIETKKRHYQDGYGKEIEYEICSPDKFRERLKTIRIATYVVRGILVGTPVALVLGLRSLVARSREGK